MVVAIIDQNGVFSFKREGQSPVAADIYGPVTFEVAMERMQSPSRSVHVFRRFGIIKGEKLFPQSFRMTGLNLRPRSAPKEQFESLVAEASDHPYSV